MWMQMNVIPALATSMLPLLFAFCVMSFIACNAVGTDAANYTATADQTPGELHASDSALVGTTGVSSPVGKFLLMRKSNHVCAIRFTKLSGGNEDGVAEYDWYFQGDGSVDFTKQNISSGHERLQWKAGFFDELLHGPRARSKISCGSFEVLWTYPNNVIFASFEAWRSKFDYNLELAPTKTTDIREVNIKNPRLQWYKLDDKRQGRFIPLEELP
jgi:hypothetical protein